MFELTHVWPGSIAEQIADAAVKYPTVPIVFVSKSVDADVRSRVPSDQRALFDELFVEARSGHRQREDVRDLCWNWPGGFVRRALLEVGRRLIANGRLIDLSCVGIGTYRGRACVVHDLMEPFDQLPALGVEESGPICHVAIVARKFGFTAVIGAQGATGRIPHRAQVEVEAAGGVVRLE